MTLIPSLTFTELRVVSMEHLQWCAMPAYPSGHLVPSPLLGTYLCSNCWNQLSRACSVFFRLFTLNIPRFFLDFALIFQVALIYLEERWKKNFGKPSGQPDRQRWNLSTPRDSLIGANKVYLPRCCGFYMISPIRGSLTREFWILYDDRSMPFQLRESCLWWAMPPWRGNGRYNWIYTPKGNNYNKNIYI